MSSDKEYSGEARPVVVAGAGPVGLVAALALRARDVPVLVVEADARGRERTGTRAIYLYGESLALLESVHPGLGAEIAEAGLQWERLRTTFRGRDVYRRELSHRTPSPPWRFGSSLSQVAQEAFICSACEEAGVVIRWDSPIRDVATSVEGVTLTLACGEQIRSKYLIGADGARSTVRKALGIGMAGSRSESAFIAIDVDEIATSRRVYERAFHYASPDAGGRNVLSVPFKGGFRTDLQCRTDDDVELLSSEAGVSGLIARVLGPEYADRVRWATVYYFLQVVAESFTEKNARVLLAGEAAHLFAPVGGRGLNSGIFDAIRAAEAIGASLSARDRAEAARFIRDAADDRRAAALFNKSAAGQALHHTEADNWQHRAKLRLAAALSPVFKRPAQWLDLAPYGPNAGRPGLSRF